MNIIVYTNKKIYIFVSTRNALYNMDIQHEIKSNINLETFKKVVLNIVFTENILSEQLNDILKPFGLSGEQFNVLRILRGQKQNPANMSCIQERMICKTSNTTRLVDKLLIKNYVTRQICATNRRKIEVNITKDGLEILAELDPKIIAHEQRFSNNLTSQELDTLNTLLEKYRILNQ